MKSDLTRAQEKVLIEIKRFIQEKGYAPTRRELSEIMGYKSANAAQEHIQSLKDKGYIRFEPKLARSLNLI